LDIHQFLFYFEFFLSPVPNVTCSNFQPPASVSASTVIFSRATGPMTLYLLFQIITAALSFSLLIPQHQLLFASIITAARPALSFTPAATAFCF